MIFGVMQEWSRAEVAGLRIGRHQSSSCLLHSPALTPEQVALYGESALG